MIYSVKIEDFPNNEMCFEVNEYLDDNNFKWKIATVKNGFFIGIYDEPPTKHIDYLNPKNVMKVYPCPNCQGGGCPVCGGFGKYPN